MICVASLLCGGLTLGNVSKPTAPLVPEPAHSGAGDRFSAVLRLSDRPEDVLRAWSTATAPTEPIQAVDTIPRGKAIVAFVFFTGCKPDKRGLCNASADFTILRPDGSVYASFSDLDLWRGKPAPPEGSLRLSAEHVGLVIEPDDPLGRYEFQISLRDRVAGTTVELKQSFTATEAQEAP